MELRVGSYRYVVRRVWALQVDGEACEGLYDAAHQLLWIDGLITDPDKVREVLRHEYDHAWEHHGCPNAAGEAGVRRNDLVFGAFAQQFEDQGGVEAVLSLPIFGVRPGPTREPYQPPVNAAARFDALTTDLRQCANSACGAMVAAGSIHSGEVEEAAPGVYLMNRDMTCPCCDVKVEWRERCTAEGLPLGGIVSARIVDRAPVAAGIRYVDD